MSVDFPAPLSPTRPTTSPGAISRSTPPTAVRPPNRLTMPRKESMGSTARLPFCSPNNEIARLVNEYGEDNHRANDDELPERLDVQHDKACLQHGNNQRADNRAADLSLTAKQTDTPDHHRCDRAE